MVDKIINEPNMVEKLTIDQIFRLLNDINLMFQERKEFPLLKLNKDPKMETSIYFAGDTHGDLNTTNWIIKNILGHERKQNNKNTKLVFLGDYVDRSPEDVRLGGIKNLMYLLCVKMSYPDDLYLLRGNHEGYDLYKFAPYELFHEINTIWGEAHSKEIHELFSSIFSNLPLFIKTSNGIFASHGGFPKNIEPQKITVNDHDDILDTLWGDPGNFSSFRGPISTMTNFTKLDFLNFLDKIGCKIMVRGHSYENMGYSLFNDKLFTVFTSRRYSMRGAGGVLLVKTSLSKDINSVQDIELYEISNEKFNKRAIMRYD